LLVCAKTNLNGWFTQHWLQELLVRAIRSMKFLKFAQMLFQFRISILGDFDGATGRWKVQQGQVSCRLGFLRSPFDHAV
jgi:hypothetical protein